ncbi:hypothetical protein LshimejAT787_1900040 [Lyophyllum shimeji]|uniref:Uncharacterized protein n=1 Tax=Lyophyllum shimeji TaxID=47721 RepID=A0A9P3Q1E2_LYOSH|nr:hypothetical protein LshimejAT787_1900040 [Lyophyllum shimeji]
MLRARRGSKTPLTRRNPAHQTHVRMQMPNMLHLLSSTFPACACGAHTRDSALRQMERFIDGLPLEEPRPPA